MKKLLLLLTLSFFSIQTFAGSCPDGSDPVRSISADGTYFVYNCGGQSSSEPGSVLVKASEINFPGKFYTTEISACKAVVPVTFSSNSSINFVKGLIGYDWHADHSANSNSMNVYHQNITEPINMFMAATHNAIGNDNQANIKIATKLLIDLAKTDTLYDSIGYIEVKNKPGCYANGDINSPCWYHEYQFASNVFSNYMITALWLKDELSAQEFEIVDKYIKKMYKKFLQPIELHKEEKGFYAMANGGTSILAYASWTNDKELAAEEIDHRFKEMDRLFYEDGYINNNSFRGYRGQWYHSYGLDIALGYVYIAELWGAEIPEKLQNKLVKAAEVVNLAIIDWDKFKSRKYDGNQSNAINDPNNAMKHTHQYAIAIDTLMKIVTGLELENDPVYLQKRRYQIGKSYGKDELIGFPPNCTLEALKTETEQAINSSKTTQTSETLKVTTSDSDPTVSKVIEVIQGDKFIVEIAEPHELAGTNINLNLRNIDAPDAVRSCPKQLELGIKVKDIVAQKLSDASSIKLKNFRKTSKAVIADVIIDGKDLGAELIGKGYASDEFGYWKAYFCSALTAMTSGNSHSRKGNFDKAIFWYERAIFLDPDYDKSTMTYRLSELYSAKGDNDKSIDYLKESANLGFMQAEETLGAAYMNGNGVKKDANEAKYWLKKAHEHGSKKAEDICGCEF